MTTDEKNQHLKSEWMKAAEFELKNMQKENLDTIAFVEQLKKKIHKHVMINAKVLIMIIITIIIFIIIVFISIIIIIRC